MSAKRQAPGETLARMPKGIREIELPAAVAGRALSRTRFRDCNDVRMGTLTKRAAPTRRTQARIIKPENQ